MQPSGLPNGHISVAEAMKMLEAETREMKPEGNIDVSYMMGHSMWIERNGNFRMPFIRKRHDYETLVKTRPHASPYENFKSLTIRIDTEADEVLLKKAIADAYRRLSGKEYVPKVTRAVSTVSTDGQVVRQEGKPVYAQEGKAVGTGGEVSMTTEAGA